MDALEQFRIWFDEAGRRIERDPNAMTLSTASATGRPSSRVVLLKHYDRRGFVFATNYDSRKGRELSENPEASLVFYWRDMGRQIRIEGRVDRADEHESDSIFDRRPRGAQIGAWASPQSQVIPGREFLEQRVREFEKTYPDRVTRPPHWGAYRLRPDYFEFWEGRSNRLHDRLCYRLQPDESWDCRRVAP